MSNMEQLNQLLTTEKIETDTGRWLASWNLDKSSCVAKICIAYLELARPKVRRAGDSEAVTAVSLLREVLLINTDLQSPGIGCVAYAILIQLTNNPDEAEELFVQATRCGAEFAVIWESYLRVMMTHNRMSPDDCIRRAVSVQLNMPCLVPLVHLLVWEHQDRPSNYFKTPEIRQQLTDASDSWREGEPTLSGFEAASFMFCLYNSGDWPACRLIRRSAERSFDEMFSLPPFTTSSTAWARARVRIVLRTTQFFPHMECLPEGGVIAVTFIATLVLLVAFGAFAGVILTQLSYVRDYYRYLIIVSVLILSGLLMALRATRYERPNAVTARENAAETETNRTLVANAFAQAGAPKSQSIVQPEFQYTAPTHAFITPVSEAA
eukprot:c16782_g1_i2.p1 GENE.c16782_g1_i2~~c16782_g1_i2.p1  ORF type:complete len:380 (+),score=72.75 c16782_g1_i2:630-1769(+)